MSDQKKALINFIKEAKKRGFSDLEIKRPLLDKGWPENQIDSAFSLINKNETKKDNEYKNKVVIYLDDKMLKTLQKRAKKNLFSLSEQIEDIIRRSCMNNLNNKTADNEKIDDLLVSLFSRKKR